MTFNQAPPQKKHGGYHYGYCDVCGYKRPLKSIYCDTCRPYDDIEQPPARWTRLDYERLHHLWRLEAFLLWWYEAERVPVIKHAIGHQINLIRSEMDDYHPRLRYFVARERDTMLRSRPLRNAIGTVQSHSANPYRKNPHHFLQLRYYKSGKHDVFPEYVEGTQS